MGGDCQTKDRGGCGTPEARISLIAELYLPKYRLLL
jgi:hypothetical protein